MMKNTVTLILTFHSALLSPNSQERGAVSYEREYTSLAEFLLDYGEQYNRDFGVDGWSVVVKS